MRLSIRQRPEGHSLIKEALYRRDVRRAIWIAAKAGIYLGYLALAGIALYGFALWYVTGNFTYSTIPVLVLAWIGWDFLVPGDIEDEEQTRPITPIA